MAQPPKPSFVIADVHSSSYTTALAVTSVREVTGTENCSNADEPVLVCGTNDGSIALWSLATYRCLRHYPPEEMTTLFQLNEPVRVTAVHSVPGCHRLLIQLKSNEIYLLDTSGSLRHPISLLEHPWIAFSTAFAQVTPVLSADHGPPLEHCHAYLAEDDTRKSLANGIQLVDSKRAVPVGSIRLVSAATEEDEEKGHGIVMALHLFTKDITAEEEEKQALYLILAHEDGFIVLYRASLRNRLETFLLEQRRAKQHQTKEPTFEAAQVSTLKSHSEMVTCIAFHEGTMRGISCSVDNEIVIWDVVIPENINATSAAADSKKPTEKNAGNEETTAKTVEEGDKDFVKETVKDTGLVERRSRRIRLTNAGILCCAIRDDGRIFATGGKDGRLRLFALRSGKPLAVLAYHSNTIESVRWFSGSSKDDLLFAASRDKSISVWSGLYPLKE